MATGNEIVEAAGKQVWTAIADFYNDRPAGMSDERITELISWRATASIKRGMPKWDELDDTQRTAFLLVFTMRLLPETVIVAETIRNGREVKTN